MSKNSGNYLIVIEGGCLELYCLDDKVQWIVGRGSQDVKPDIRLYSPTVSREHGKFKNVDGFWYYYDNHGKNGTVCNDKHIEPGIRGRKKPIMLKNGDTFVFGGGTEKIINHKTVWAMYLDYRYNSNWRIVDTKDYKNLQFINGEEVISYKEPERGCGVNRETVMAIYMGGITYLWGDMKVTGS